MTDGSVALVKVGIAGEINTTSVAAEPVIAFIYAARGLMANLSLESTKINKLEKHRPTARPAAGRSTRGAARRRARGAAALAAVDFRGRTARTARRAWRRRVARGRRW